MILAGGGLSIAAVAGGKKVYDKNKDKINQAIGTLGIGKKTSTIPKEEVPALSAERTVVLATDSSQTDANSEKLKDESDPAKPTGIKFYYKKAYTTEVVVEYQRTPDFEMKFPFTMPNGFG